MSIPSKGQIMLGKKESMRLPSVILTCLVFSMGVAPVFAQTSQSYVINDAQSGQSFQVPYDITGAIVSDMSISPHDTSLVILLKSSDDGNLTMTLPRSLIDAKNGANDDQFFVLVDGAEADFAEHKTSTDRTITVFIPKDTIQVEVIGTQVVPEFGMLSSLVLVIAIISIITVSTKTRLKFV